MEISMDLTSAVLWQLHYVNVVEQEEGTDMVEK